MGWIQFSVRENRITNNEDVSGIVKDGIQKCGKNILVIVKFSPVGKIVILEVKKEVFPKSLFCSLGTHIRIFC